MEISPAMVAALVLVLLVVGANIFMLAFVRAFIRSDRKGFWEILGRSFDFSSKRNGDSMDELHRRIRDLEQKQGHGGEGPE